MGAEGHGGAGGRARWLLVPPAAVGAPILILLGLSAVGERRYPFSSPTWFVLLAFVLLAVSCVLGAALMAPARRRLVALVAASVFTAVVLGLSLLMTLSSNWSFSLSPGWAIVAVVIGVVTAFGTAVGVGGERA
jgi:hypothetical protein